VTQVASSTADLVARPEKQISHTAIGDIMKVDGDILEPSSQTPLEITLRNVTSSSANATTTKQSGSCTSVVVAEAPMTTGRSSATTS
jgi:hypothetical protein